MSAQVKKEIHLEIAHVLFMDVVGFSKLLINVIPRLQNLLEIPYTNLLTLALLRFDPRWDPLRGDPRFEKLAASPTPK